MRVKVPVLTYHSIDESGSIISTSPENFRRQMGILSESGFNVISLKELTASLHENRSLSPKQIALTFDDGFQNFYTKAFPILLEYGFTATVFLVTDYCDKYNDWPGNLPTLGKSKLLSWNEIKELNKYDIDFGAHTSTHPDLTRLSTAETEKEMVQSKKKIEDHLGAEVTDFAYPYGRYNERVKRMTRNYFRGACSTDLGVVHTESDLFSLKRVDSYYLSNDRIFRLLSSNSLDWYWVLRQAMRDLKQLFNR